MGTLIVVGNEKGGCGKTTLSVNIAAMAAGKGRDVLLVDGDAGQQSSAKWAARRADAHPNASQVRSVSLTGRGMVIAKELQDLRRRYEVVVVDTGAEDSPELRAAATVADVLVVPVQPDALDLWTLPTIETIYQKSRDFNEALRVVLVLNRVPYQTADQTRREVEEWVKKEVPDLVMGAPVTIIGRAAYNRATGEGLGVAEMVKRDVKAVVEMTALVEQVLS